MEVKDIHSKDARFDTRLSKEQKELFEKAANIGGFKSLSDFVVVTVQEKANEIIAERERVIVSQKDSEVFFDAVLNPKSPNKDLIKAAEEFKNIFS